MTHFYIGEFHRNTGQPEAALDSYDRAREILQRVAAANPAVTQIRSDLARSHLAIGQLLKATGKLAPARYRPVARWPFVNTWRKPTPRSPSFRAFWH